MAFDSTHVTKLSHGMAVTGRVVIGAGDRRKREGPDAKLCVWPFPWCSVL
jgi:hypothetical protein